MYSADAVRITNRLDDAMLMAQDNSMLYLVVVQIKACFIQVPYRELHFTAKFSIILVPVTKCLWMQMSSQLGRFPIS